MAWKYGEKSNDNPWECTTLEWQTPTPPGHGNFLVEPVVTRGPYEYSVPGEEVDFLPQNYQEPEKKPGPTTLFHPVVFQTHANSLRS
jgi:cytochrome c oxidase subunit 1